MGTFFPDLQPKIGTETQWPEGGSPYYQQLAYWCNAAYEEAKGDVAGDEDVQIMGKMIDYLAGRQWPKARSSKKASPVNNHMWKLFWEAIGNLTDLKPIYNVKSIDRNLAFIKQAEVLNKLAASWWTLAEADLGLALIIIYAMFSTGFAKVEWNPAKLNGWGDLDLVPLGPNDCLPLKPKTTMDTAEAVIYQAVQPLSFFRKKFGARGSLVQPDPAYSKFALPDQKPAHIGSLQYQLLSPQMQRLLNKPGELKASAFPMALYREFWMNDWTYNSSSHTVAMGLSGSNWEYKVKPGDLLYPRGRLVIMGGNTILHDGPNPYWHGMKPFACLRMNVVPWKFYGMSEVRSWSMLQDILNDILAGVLNMVKKATNPGIIAPRNAFDESVWEQLDMSLPNFKAAYNQMAVAKPELTPAPQVPAYVMQTYGMVAKDLKEHSGASAMDEALRKKQVPGGDTLEAINRTKNTPYRLKGRMIEQFLTPVGQMGISGFMQFYTAERRYFMLGHDGLLAADVDSDPGTMIPQNANPTDHIRRFRFSIQPGSLLHIQQLDQANQLIALRRMGDLDRTTMFERLTELGLDATVVEARLKKERESGVPMLPPKGKGGGHK